MRALITGGFGFVGRHLARYLVTCGDDVAVTYHPSERGSADEAFRTALPQAAQTFALDIADKKAVDQLLTIVQPDALYHLAALSYVPDGETQQDLIFQTNSFGTMNLLDGLVKTSPKTRFLYVSSAEVYGEPWPGSLPLVETAVLRPVSNYGLSKVLGDLAAFKYSVRDSLDTVRVRPFPHIGPGQSDQFAVSSFARQLAEVKLGRREPVIKVGN
ncbi:MAG: GDP-mannose 4,6-dehydratase, partial [Deltaproteobacteria bacterium]|nr:GDP-mannose 4,6-dehydratase [Deltaproteobacteria bacterium]